MTLGRQLVLSGLIVLIGLFLGMMAFTLNNTQQFLNAQLSENSQETANLLGLSLSTVMKKKDTLFAGRMVDSIWDAGYYKTIQVEGVEGDIWVNKAQGIQFQNVPSWFVSHIPLKTDLKEAVIQSGWMQIGKVKVESNPGFAYKQIWQTTRDSVIWLGFMSLLTGLLGSALLYIILKPLRAITKQANELCHQQFSIVEPLPKTLDLRQVVEAMNNMSRRLKAIFEDNARRSLELQNQAYQSPVTQLPNRRYFDLQLNHLLQDQEHPAFGILGLIEVTQFKLLNETKGYKEGDEYLKRIAEMLSTATSPMEGAIVAHLGGANFAIVLPNKTKEEGIALAKSLLHTFKILKQEYPAQNMGVGLCDIDPQKTVSELLAQADTALRKALFQDANAFHFSEGVASSFVMSASQWVDFFKDIIEKQEITLYYQSYKLLESSDVFYEVLLRLKKENELIPAAAFMPMAERLALMPELDKLVIMAISHKLKNNPQKNIFYSLNISPGSLENKDFLNWMLEAIRALGELAHQIIIELPEYGVVSRIEMINSLFKELNELGCKTAIDHYGRGFTSFGYLKSLRVNYLKIDGSYISKIETSKENQFFIHSLVNIAHSLDIKVIAESIETQAEYDMVCQLKVDGVQGYFIGHPQSD